MTVKKIPDGYHSITPYITVEDGYKALAFYKAAFGAVETMLLPMGERVGHAEIQIGDSRVMLGEEWPSMDMLSPKKRGGTSSGLMVYVEDVDAAFARAIAAGATELSAVTDQFYGDRSGKVADPFGHQWTLGTHVEDVDPTEMGRRMADWAAGQRPGTDD